MTTMLERAATGVWRKMMMSVTENSADLDAIDKDSPMWGTAMELARAAIVELREMDAATEQAVIASEAFAEVNDIVAQHAIRTATRGISKDPFPIAWTAAVDAIVGPE